MINFSSRLFAEALAKAARDAVAASESPDMKGIEVRIESTRYGNGRVRVTLEFTEAGVDRKEIEFGRAAALVGLKPEDYGALIQVQHERFNISGISLNRPKFPIDIKRTRDGKMFKLTESGALKALGRT